MDLYTDPEPPPPDSATVTINGATTLDENLEAPPPSPSPSPPPSPPELQLPIRWPEDGILTIEWIQNLILCFDWSSKNLPPSQFPSVLPVQVFDSLILIASKMLHKEPNCVPIQPFRPEPDSSASVVVVGDVHGQLHDVLFLFREAGYPSRDRIFVFNGDYVDRGAWGLETFLLLLAWKVFMPENIYLLRGNHESKYCTSVYGFEKEVMVKYSDSGKHVYRKCLGCFEGLPLASIIAGCVYTAHGGLFRSVTVTPAKRLKGKKNRRINVNTDSKKLSLGSLEELSRARRSVLDPPWEGQNLIPGDVLWSDPSQTNGLSPNKERGIGLMWGPDCTEQFLKKYQFKLIIRSHEGPDAREKRDGFEGMAEGYTIDHVVDSGKLVTVFSAPDYPQFQTLTWNLQPRVLLKRIGCYSTAISEVTEPRLTHQFDSMFFLNLLATAIRGLGMAFRKNKATEERYNNKGAYIVLEPPSFDTPIFHGFSAVTPRPKANPYYDYEEVIDSDGELDLASMVTS